MSFEQKYPLSEIVNDLWGWSQPAAASPKAADAQDTPSPEAERTYQPAFPPFDQLWQVADETVEWTEALVREQPSAGQDAANWSWLRQNASAVLRGDREAYVRVMKHFDPLGDLRPYAQSFSVTTVDGDTLRCSFQVQPHYETISGAETRRYLAGLSLRVARDLMALLPVQQVAVEARRGSAVQLQATYSREALQRVRFGFTDPVALTEACGGIFQLD